MDNKINIKGISIGAKNRFVGNPDHANGVLVVGMDGAIARLHLQVFDGDEIEGVTSFRLRKDEASSLIKMISKLYNLEDEASGLIEAISKVQNRD
jgi:hypothetical protein